MIMRRRSIGRRFSCNVTPCDTTCSRSISCNIYRQIISNRIIFKLIAVCSLCLCGRVRKPNMSSCISSTFSSGYICSCSCIILESLHPYLVINKDAVTAVVALSAVVACFTLLFASAVLSTLPSPT